MEQRSPQQNNSIHLFFRQLSDQCNEKGIEMRDIVKDEIPIPVTPENVKMLWKRVQTHMFGKKSTTELKKTGEIDQVYDVFCKLIAERTEGEVEIPPLPSKEETYLNAPNLDIDYPEFNGEPKL